MGRVIIDQERCKGCLLCTSVCPNGALAPAKSLNTQGYKPVEPVENGETTCIGCGFCAEICPDMAILVFRSPKEKQKENAA